MLFSIAAPAINERGPRYMEKALAAIHQACNTNQEFALEYGLVDGTVGLFVRVSDSLRSRVVEPIIANYPNCSIAAVSDESVPADLQMWSAELQLAPDLFPILRHAQFEDLLNGNLADPINGILRAIKPEPNVHCRIIIAARPASDRVRHRSVRAVRLLDREFFRRHHRLSTYFARHIVRGKWRILAQFLGLLALRTAAPLHSAVEVSASRLHDREDDLQAAAEKIGAHLFQTRIAMVVYAPNDRIRDALDRIQLIVGAFGAFTKSRLATFAIGAIRSGDSPFGQLPGFLLSHEELATLWHPPTSMVAAERMQMSEFTELEAPASVYSGPEQGAIVLGRARFRSDERQIGLSLEDRRRHLYIVGKTGMGKTTLLESQINADIQMGRGVCLIDPHGDLADRVVAAIPSGRTNDVILLDPSDDEFALTYNPLACPARDRRDLVADNVLSAFAKTYDLAHTPRLKDTLRNALYILIEKDMTMLDLLVFFSDQRFRRQVLVGVEDDVARLFWEVEFPSWNERYRTEALSAVQNKVRPFLMNSRIRAIVGQRRKPLNLRQVMDDGKVLIVNLSKGKIGEENSTLLGSFLVSSLQQAAMSRAELPENERRDFYLYIDEFQNFATSSFATILSEARKYRLNLTVAHQYLKQLDETTADAVFGNVGSIVSFQVGSDDADVLTRQLAKHEGQLTNRDLTNLPRFTAYARLLLEGLPSNPFSLQTVMPAAPENDRSTAVRDASRRQYSQPLSIVRLRIREDLFARPQPTLRT